jgi:hypothetical protein
MRIPALLCVVACGVPLMACTEQPQTATHRKADGHAYEGTNDGHAVPGWKAGDAASWEQQMRTRAQAQTEYSRTSAP